ncbi:MAG: tetratricopeptide repeat protein [Alphaproteobacteria bacterium]|nr:tetratricopeptide repeat protein [Alphaproteobacteria bacterium]
MDGNLKVLSALRWMAIALLLSLSPVNAFAQQTDVTAGQSDAAVLWDQAAAAGVQYYQQGDLEKAIEETLRSKTIAIDAFGQQSTYAATSLNNLGVFYGQQGRYPEAVDALTISAAVRRDILGPNDSNTISTQFELAGALRAAGDPGASAQTFKQILSAYEATGQKDLILFRTLYWLGYDASQSDDDVAASGYYARAWQTAEAIGGHDTLEKAHLAMVWAEYQSGEEQTALYREALAIRERELGPDHPQVADTLNAMGLSLYGSDDRSAAELMLKRALAIREVSLEPNHIDTGETLRNLGLVAMQDGRYDLSETYARRALKMAEDGGYVETQHTSRIMNNLALTLQSLGKGQETIAMFRRALALDEKLLGPNHSDTGIALNNLARAIAEYSPIAGYGEARQLYDRAIELRERVLGPDHPDVAIALDELAVLQTRVFDYEGAQANFDRAVEIYLKSDDADRLESLDYLFFASAANQLRLGPEHRASAFETIQRGMGGAANRALSANAARLSASDPELSSLVREKQDMAAERRKKISGSYLAFGEGNRALGETLSSQAQDLQKELTRLETRLEDEFPAYAQLTANPPLGWREVVGLLKPGEALVLMVPGQIRDTADDVPGSIFMVGWDGRSYVGDLEAGTYLRGAAAQFRCGVYPVGPTCDYVNSLTQAADETRGAINMSGGGERQPGTRFDFELAYGLYARTLMPVEPYLEGVDHLILVNQSAELSSLPFQMLLAKPYQPLGRDETALREAPWLIRDYAISTLPTVGALRSLRGNKSLVRNATKPFLGVGDPIIGSRGKIDCGPARNNLVAALDDNNSPDTIALRSAGGSTGDLYPEGFANPIADVAQIRRFSRLPETRCELEAVAESLGGGELLLDESATERSLKALQARNELGQYRVISFATHGLVAGEAGSSEPALILTPPETGTLEDDGLLTASEIATFELNADWVILSACNTAAGSGQDGESLSGLARGFFYAGAKSVLVSNWPVNTHAATRLTTATFAAMESDPELGRAKALQLAMLDVLEDPTSTLRQLEPFYWAPFSIAGEGGPIAAQ